MKWFKHFTDSHRDPDVCDGYAIFSHLSYVFFQCLKEAYSEFHDLRDDCGFIRLSLVNISRRCHTKPGKIIRLFSFFQERNRLIYRIENTFVFFQVIEFEKLIGHWRQRRDTAEGAPSVQGRGDEEEKKEEEKIYEEQKKEDSDADGVVSAANEILDYFNKKTGKNFTDPARIVSLLRAGRKKEDFLRIIEVKSEDDFFRKNRRLFNLQTFFSGDHFEKYLQEYHDRGNDAENPSEDISLPAVENKEKKIAYQRFLENEHAPLQDAFVPLLREHNLYDYVIASGFDEHDFGFAVVSLENQALRIFSASFFPGYTTMLGKYLKEEAGIALEYVWEVPDDFADSECIPKGG